jgi:hypothetical protein
MKNIVKVKYIQKFFYFHLYLFTDIYFSVLVDLPFIPLFLVTSSKAEHLGRMERSGWTYIQGAGDDEQHWAMGTNNTFKILQCCSSYAYANMEQCIVCFFCFFWVFVGFNPRIILATSFNIVIITNGRM